MKTRIFPVFFALFCFVTVNSFAQQRFIQGIVTTFDSITIVGAEVMVKSSKEIVKTDSLGQFKVKVDGKDKLKISAKGFINQNVKLDEKTKLVAVNLKLKAGEKAREYAIGYGYVKDGERLNALAQMTSDDVDFSQYTSMYDLMRGRFAGVQIQSNGDIIIRGINSINLSSAALIVVDGVQVDGSVMSTLVPSQVKSINVIKDGSAAIYGARGANGVVVIETKKGTDD
ncbi:TonB-dependent outer membrane receptor, SusC/RagA subfamily, signature region [Draconibacterium orientale]|uniref:TonB-dependent outer membrane receptor, SusC/RagA subfamily, signature region n=1 Tax=Draconibacterium orientale TaxID=1168034 RepID=X5DGQ2_9BACT|nr:TonB-dependent receptor plug domain-containing protein [Draconibacterium orientale]AHW60239.1 TonB-dependent receptor [Draconibacterium orientale]SET65934.1 TonB-dependent outer membrane receptor, SusC/RagA subfamily, signature region [Draconibacterium orientale]